MNCDVQFGRGETYYGHHKYLELSNDTDSDAHIRIIYRLDDGGQRIEHISAAGRSKINIPVDSFLGEKMGYSCRVQADQTVEAKRAVYSNGNSR